MYYRKGIQLIWPGGFTLSLSNRNCIQFDLQKYIGLGILLKLNSGQMYIESNWSNVSDFAGLYRREKKSEIRFVRIPSKACFIIFVVGYLTINLLQNFPLSKSERERHLPIETPPGLKIFQDDKLKKEKLKTENKPEDGTEDIPASSKSTSIGE